MSNSNATHRSFVNAAINTELDPTDCVKSSADKDDFNGDTRKSKTNVVSLYCKTIDLWQFISNQYQH